MKLRKIVMSIFVLMLASAFAASNLLAAAGPSVLADFEGGAPAGWFIFNGASTVSTPTQTVAESDSLARPGQVGNNELLAANFNVTDFGGFGQDLVAIAGPQDWSSNVSFNFWFHGSGSGLAYQAEISDNRSDPNSDTSERFDYTFTDSSAGWRYISIPFTSFTRATDFQPGGAPNDGFTLTEIWAWAIVLPQGNDIIYLDDFTLGQPILDDFESGLPTGAEGSVPVGFFTFSDGSPIAISTTSTPPAAVLGSLPGNNVLQMDANVAGFAGFIHNFQNSTNNGWVSQDWSRYQGISFWLFGNNSGKALFVDILDNRNPGATTDDAERWTVAFQDDFSGWKLFELPFTSFSRKEIGNGAPNDGLGLTEMHGWAFGTLNTGGAKSYFIDDVGLYGVAEVPALAVTFSVNRFDIAEGATGAITVKLNRPMNADDPAQVSVDYTTEAAIAIAGREYTPALGTLTFVNGGPSEQTFSLVTFDDNKYEGDERIALRLFNLVDVATGFITQASAFIVDNDAYDPNLIDDFEQGAYLWNTTGSVTLTTPEIVAGAALAVPGQGGYEHILVANTPVLVDIVVSGNVCEKGNGVVPVAILTNETFDAATVNADSVRFGNAVETHRVKKTGAAQRHLEDFDKDGDKDLVLHFRAKEIGAIGCTKDKDNKEDDKNSSSGEKKKDTNKDDDSRPCAESRSRNDHRCDRPQVTLTGKTLTGQSIIANGTASLMHDFAIGQNWSRGEALRFWFYGTNSGDAITVQLKDNRATDPGPAGWTLAWSDEFNDPAGTLPNPANWSYEFGDVTPDGKNGWGNEELQYYTNDPANAATDGSGNLALTLRQANGSQQCYYGPCQYTSARLISWHKQEFAYGRIESRLKVPRGTGIWPAFWSLGTDIDRVAWPQTGEIDFMEFVGRLPNEIFGTIHGPGYAGGQSFGNIYSFGQPVYSDYHTFSVEWQPNLIQWYVDGILYHTASPADVNPNEWVFNDPVFLLLNVAVGGNFGGAVGADLVPPQSMLVDYVRVYQGPDTAERWEASFADSFSGWQEVVLPFSSFTRSADQPAGAPDDGLGLKDVWGYGFELPEGGTTGGTLRMDQVRLQLLPPPTAITVTNLNNSGEGSLRQALADIAIGGKITFDPALAGGTINLSSGPFVLNQDVTIDGSTADGSTGLGITLNGGGGDRVLIVAAGVNAEVAYLTLTNGYGFQLAGGILNNGNLTLDHVTVTGNTVTTNAGDFWQGGAGIYNGEGSRLNLLDSTVSNNSSGWSGGGIYVFFNANVLIERSTISGNSAQDTGGGLRTLGNVTILNSTVSGNVSNGWHGGAAFVTDGTVDVINSTIANNSAPAGVTGGFFVGTFTAASATLNLSNSILANNSGTNCVAGYFGAGAVILASAGHNVASDSSCNTSAVGDQSNIDPLLGVLVNNGGPTLTHALGAGSPAIDAADATLCSATDQRGVTRPQGSGCDVGAVEFDGVVTGAGADTLQAESGTGKTFLPLVSR